MTDIHSHVLWGMDDGAPTESASLEMLRIAADSGTTDIVATPHSNAEFEYVPDLIDERIHHLNAKTGGIPRIHRGCDLHLNYDNIVEAQQNPAKYSINGGRYVLVECSDLHISGAMDKIFDQLLAADLVPIVTHPERNPILRKEPQRLEAFVDLGCLVQVTALSILGGFGKSAKAAAARLLSKGMVHVVASDAHDPIHRHPRLDQAFAEIQTQYGVPTAHRLFTTNPGKIILNQYVPADRLPPSGPRPWWRVWGNESHPG